MIKPKPFDLYYIRVYVDVSGIRGLNPKPRNLGPKPQTRELKQSPNPTSFI